MQCLYFYGCWTISNGQLASAGKLLNSRDMDKEVNHSRMASRTKNETASSISGEHAAPNKEQSLVFRIPRDLSLIVELRL